MKEKEPENTPEFQLAGRKVVAGLTVLADVVRRLEKEFNTLQRLDENEICDRMTDQSIEKFWLVIRGKCDKQILSEMERLTGKHRIRNLEVEDVLGSDEERTPEEEFLIALHELISVHKTLQSLQKKLCTANEALRKALVENGTPTLVSAKGDPETVAIIRLTRIVSKFKWYIINTNSLEREVDHILWSLEKELKKRKK